MRGSGKLVTSLAEHAIHSKGNSSKYYVIMTLEVRNAYNLANWCLTKKSQVTFCVPTYLVAIVDS